MTSLVSQSILSSGGRQALLIENLWWLFLAVCTIVYVLVIAAALRAISAPRNTVATSERRLTIAVVSASLVTVTIVLALCVISYSTGRALAALPTESALTIRVQAHQWWWEITYPSSKPSETFTTANELHVPVGRAVVLELSSSDVIHSFWAPSLAGKRDMIPGRETALALRADHVGTFRVQCAEFCGLQHALMAMPLVAEPMEEFESWAARQRSAPPPPQSADEKMGQEIFLSRQCAMCHRIAGTSASATVAPDLSHFATRATIAAGTLPNTPEHRALWVRDPQRVKPGVKMPATPLSPDELQALVTYLQSLS